jgi:hypothetical protein
VIEARSERAQLGFKIQHLHKLCGLIDKCRLDSQLKKVSDEHEKYMGVIRKEEIANMKKLEKQKKEDEKRAKE